MSTRVLSPGKAVIWAAFFNFVAAFAFGTAVAKTIGSGLVDIRVVTFAVIFAGLIGAIVWDLITWYCGLPTSSSHALIGGYGGAAVAKAGFAAIVPGGWTQDARLHRPGAAHRAGAGLPADDRDPLDLRADLALAGSTTGSAACSSLSAAAYSLGHGGNDAQKTMGIIAGVLVAGGYWDWWTGSCRFRSG